MKDPKAEVWLVVHPLSNPGYWVQPRVTVRANGDWKVQVYIGNPGRQDEGCYYEVRALANSRTSLSEGLILSDWPSADSVSDIVEVLRI